jgi:hypothetical protein
LVICVLTEGLSMLPFCKMVSNSKSDLKDEI